MEEIVKKFDSMSEILKGFSDKMDSVFKRIEALESPPKDKHDDDEAEDKKDAVSIATEVIRSKLDGLLPKEKLDAMSLIDLSQTLASIKQTIENPSASGGILNQIGGKDKTDSFKKGLFAKKEDAHGVVFE